MGLRRQHHLQQACLARTRDNMLAACIVLATVELFNMGPALVSTQGRACGDELLTEWEQTAKHCGVSWVTNEEVNALSTLADIYTNTEAVDACISPTVLADCAPIIQKLFDPNDVEISHEFRILMSEDPSHETLQEEPSVKYIYAYRHCHVVFWRRLANRVVLLLLLLLSKFQAHSARHRSGEYPFCVGSHWERSRPSSLSPLPWEWPPTFPKHDPLLRR